MNKNIDTGSQQSEAQNDDKWPPLGIVKVSDFRAVDYNAIVRGLKTVYDSYLEAEFTKAAKASRSSEPSCSVFRLLASAMGLHFRLNDKAGAYGPKMVFGNQRTAIPEDWIGEQNNQFFEVLEDIEHPALRARLADVVWTNDKRKNSAAKIAVAAYCDCVEGLINGKFGPRFPSDREVNLEEVDLIERASQIHYKSTKRTEPMCERVATFIHKLYAVALGNVDVVPLKRLAQLRARFGLIEMKELALDMESAAKAAESSPKSYPLAIKGLWELAAFGYQEEKREDDARRCRLAGVEQTLAMAPQTGSSSGAAHWYRQAIGELRHIRGTEERRDELRKELRELQEKSLDEMGSFETPVDLSDLVDQTTKDFEKFGMAEAFRQFAFLAFPPNSEQMKKEALSQETGIAGLFSTTHLDSEGKVVGEVEGASMAGDPPSDAWVKSKLIQSLQVRAQIAINGRIEPARQVLAFNFPVLARHLRVIARHSPFVPPSHIETFSLGFTRLLQGDLLSASSILIPQLEHCLRYVLINNSKDTSKMRNDLTQEDRSLSAILDAYRKEMSDIFGEDNTMCIDLIFNHRPGPALRHEFAHGKIGDNSRRDAIIYYACCFMFLLTCIPLIPIWAEIITPALDNESF
ncbi:hypothetical protein F9K97_05600 [Brucella anthropi]|uniref:DUF7380 domain-containing protein n=1 Tax=Brucella anthropi TaxID=529 RepID=UPI00124CFDC9|nr:hypothetical protein [Brucella anthropi]KAB2788554.1 hypothetical protein F9K97_05600 [Brucella anthropi]